MKKLIILLLAFQLLSNNTFMEEMMRLPVLFEHFADHHNKDTRSNGFFHFLYDHYVENHGEKPDNHDHNLPFNHSDCTNHSHSDITFIATVNALDHPTNNKECVLKFFSESILNNQISSSIWQPPKV